jgi:hypothetical protein
MMIYVAGPYRGEVDRNIQQAREIAIALWRMGHVAICPHLNTAHFEVDAQLPDETYLRGDLAMLARCDAVVLTPDWTQSLGACGEQAVAVASGIPCYVWPECPPLHPTEVSAPQQCEAFIRIVMRQYRMHLDKNNDYSPANILGAGWIGLVTRIWDKVARLMNLAGFRLQMSEPSEFVAPKSPKCESVDDTLRDLSNYGVIGQIMREGVWGK